MMARHIQVNGVSLCNWDRHDITVAAFKAKLQLVCQPAEGHEQIVAFLRKHGVVKAEIVEGPCRQRDE